ncbi:MAG: carboxypeptidase regulatory-like domain-containing protein [Planctomycetes bacterium]|nr:carboxypeptidase regulatory-like domain-containing protein [Planctomycetota bacterium]
MRRVMLLLGVLLAAMLLAWWALHDDPLAPGADGPGVRVGTGEDADGAADDVAKGKKPRDRAKAGARAAVEDPTLPPWMREWPEVGQDVPQDPSLGAIAGAVYVTQGVAAEECVIEATLRGAVLARVRLRGTATFRLKNVAPGSGIALTARSEFYAPGGLDKLQVRPGVVTDVGTVYLGLAMDPDVRNSLDVEVVADGKPVANADVTATTVFYGSLVSLGNLEKQPGGTILRAQTDASGRARFERLPPSAYDVFAEADGLTFEVKQRQILQKTSDVSVRLEMKPALTIEGKAQTEDGTPVAGARVILLRWNSFTNVPPAVTDAEGKFTAKGLSGGNYFVVVAKDDLGSKDTQNVPAGTKDLVVVIPTGAELWIKCVDSATGAPITSYGVRPFRKVPFAYLFAPLMEARTTDGVFKTKLLPASDYGAEITAPGYAMANVATVPLSPKEAFEVKLEASGLVRGRVVERGTGKVIRGAQIYVKRGGFPPSKVKDQQTVSDAQGMFLLDHLPLRPLSIWISHVDHDEATFEGVAPVAKTANGAVDATMLPARDFALGSGGRIEGRVFASGGGAVSGAVMAGENVVLVVGFDFTNQRNATTDAQGRYQFTNVPVGPKYTVSVGQFNPGRAGRSKSDVVVTEGQATVVDFNEATGGQRVTGRILRGELPGADVQVTLLSDDGGQFSGQERSKPDGSFAFDNVPAGKYMVRAQGGGSRMANLTVKPDQPPAEVVLVLATAGISGKVVDATTGLAINGAWVECDQLSDSAGSTLSDLVRTNRGRNPAGVDGTFQFRGLEDGTYQVRAVRDGYGTELFDGIVIANGVSKDGVTVALGPACTVAGLVTNAQGTPVEGASIQIRDARGRRVFSIALTQTNGDGTYSQGTLRPDVYDITFEKDGYAPATQRVTLTTGAAVKLDFTMLQGGRIEVSVRDAGGAPVKDAVITLYDASGKAVTKGITLTNLFSLNRNRTDANGVVLVTGVAAGVYRVSVTPAGRDDVTERAGVEVVEGGLTPVEIAVAAPAGN